MRFHIERRSKLSHARCGFLETEHGTIETPAFVPVATRAVLKTLPSFIAKEIGFKLIIANTYHLHLTAGEDRIAAAGGLHRFMSWDGPIMTDSGGFQVFSLGFGQDLDLGKFAGVFSETKNKKKIEEDSQPSRVKISEDGVFFQSPIDGSKHFLGPKESMDIQAKLGSDIIFAFDECTSPHTTEGYLRKSLSRTHRWASQSLEHKKEGQAIYGIVQGSHYRELREMSATNIASLPFDGFGIGGDLGNSKEDMHLILEWTIPLLSENKPRHLLGIGYPDDFEAIVRQGVDTFDCIVPTLHARHGIAFTNQGRINLHNACHLGDRSPLDPDCSCAVCTGHTRDYLAHLIRMNEIAGLMMLSLHNLHFFNAMVVRIRGRIREGVL